MILITGCARSGTSMIAGIIHQCGGYPGVIGPPNRNNKKGMFENTKIRKDVVKPYLARHRLDPKGQKPIPQELKDVPPFPNLKSRVMNIFKNQGWDGKTPLYYKGAKMTLVWPEWYAAFPDAQWIWVRRPTDQIVASCMRTSFMSAYGHPDGWVGWVNTHLKRLEEMKRYGLNVKEVWSNEIVKDPDKAKEMIDWVGLTWNAKAVHKFVEPKYYTAGQTQKPSKN